MAEEQSEREARRGDKRPRGKNQRGGDKEDEEDEETGKNGSSG